MQLLRPGRWGGHTSSMNRGPWSWSTKVLCLRAPVRAANGGGDARNPNPTATASRPLRSRSLVRPMYHLLKGLHEYLTR